MAYEKQTWEDYPSTNTPITSDRLNHIEQGIYDNSTDILSTAIQLRNEMKTNIITNQEVATNEYIDGKRVYKIIIQENNVTLASNTTHTLAHNILNCKEIIEGQYLLRYKDGSTYYNYFDWQGVKHFRASNTDIQLIMGIADSTFEYIKYTLKYTKN